MRAVQWPAGKGTSWESFFFCFRQEHRTEDKQAMAIQSHFLEPLVGASLLAIFSSKYSLRERDMTAQTSTLTIWAKAKNMKRKEHQQFFRRFLPSKVSMGLTRRNQLDQTRSKSKSTKLYPPPFPWLPASWYQIRVEQLRTPPTCRPAMSSNETLTPPSTISSRISEANFESTPLMAAVRLTRLLMPDPAEAVAVLDAA